MSADLPRPEADAEWWTLDHLAEPGAFVLRHAEPPLEETRFTAVTYVGLLDGIFLEVYLCPGHGYVAVFHTGVDAQAIWARNVGELVRIYEKFLPIIAAATNTDVQEMVLNAEEEPPEPPAPRRRK